MKIKSREPKWSYIKRKLLGGMIRRINLSQKKDKHLTDEISEGGRNDVSEFRTIMGNQKGTLFAKSIFLSQDG